ncbi:NAD(P)-dependent alcohol dehydrogenase [Microbacterium sp. NIBRBAC000506063]|uniref:NAD(P)-dependent alcohol dehydrogenase n=1 Tax=Microbacterium sp. NIBRBAC000506063 TaxID=2734618 RepID=UPI001CB6E4BA|nr:NAD(P)-dependent alcohol dehydrogenase [Microbacterium sp. NIBRBAC000506063]
MTTTMRAWTQRGYGGPETVSRERLPVPSPKPRQVVVRMRAVGLNAGDVHLLRGDPLLVRLAFGLMRPKQPVRGMDVAGRVTAVGAKVSGFAVGDEVVAEAGGGGLASFVPVDAKRLARRPENVDPDAAAVLPIAAGTAAQALDLAGVAAGHRVLVIGASGGVGTFAVQLTTIRGAEVWALCGQHSQQLVEDLGAVRTFDYRQTDAGDLLANSFDAIIDLAGTAPLRVLHDLLAPAGTLVLVGGEGGRVLGPIPGCCRRRCCARGRGAASALSRRRRTPSSCRISSRSPRKGGSPR